MSVQVDVKFRELLETLTIQAQRNAYAEDYGTDRVWMTPGEHDTNVFDIRDMQLDAFSRESLNEKYIEIHKDPKEGHVGEAAAIKIQMDYMAVAERAFRYRHASYVRCLAHTSARDAGHGDESGVYSGVLNYVQDLIQKANG